MVVASITTEAIAAPMTLTAIAAVAVEGGRETAPPIGAEVPRVVGWQSEDGQNRSDATLDLQPGDPARWTVFVVPAGDAATRLDIRSSSA